MGCLKKLPFEGGQVLKLFEYWLRTLNSQLLDKISKFCYVDFVPLMWELFLPNFSPLALKLWEEIEVTDRQMDGRHALSTWSLYKINIYL